MAPIVVRVKHKLLLMAHSHYSVPACHINLLSHIATPATRTDLMFVTLPSLSWSKVCALVIASTLQDLPKDNYLVGSWATCTPPRGSIPRNTIQGKFITVAVLSFSHHCGSSVIFLPHFVCLFVVCLPQNINSMRIGTVCVLPIIIFPLSRTVLGT